LPRPAPPAPTAAAPAPSVAPAPRSAPAAPAAVPAAPATPTGGGEETYVTPLVRKLAAEHGVDLASLAGTGVGGRIRKQDVLEAAERQRAEAASRAVAAAAAPSAAATAPAVAAAASTATAAAALRGRTEPLSRLRKVIAQRMVESLQVSAQLTTVVEVDVTRIAGLRARAKSEFEAREGVKLSFLPFFAKAAVDALKTYPQVNASIDTEAGTVTYHESEHLGIAVDTERGLLVPVIRSAGDLTLAGLARKITDLAERTRGNKITPDELSGGTFTLTNTGSRGALFDTPIINQPQVAILGTGTVVKRPVVVTDPDTGTDGIAIRSMAYFALTYDHRLVDGADAARFLVAIKQRLEDGAFEAELGL
ncbi:MAG: 2-oxoglutarate dehydrogenase, E2 component, dihydrolipoamide succinyltransferase, partial [Actinomycetes bacterium]